MAAEAGLAPCEDSSVLTEEEGLFRMLCFAWQNTVTGAVCSLTTQMFAAPKSLHAVTV
jgi:hypothetical protein